MYASRFQKRKANAKRPVKRVPRKRSGGRKAITKIVKSIISSQAEQKSWFDYGANNSILTSVTVTPTYKNLVPVLSQGVGHSGRIGNEVRIKSGYVRGHVNILPYSALSNPGPAPVFVKIWVLSCKQINDKVLSSTPISYDFFDVVNSSVGLQGNMLDMELTINKDMWVSHGSKTVKIGAGFGTSTGNVSLQSYFDNSPMSAPFYFNLGKILKTCKYDDTSTTCSNKNLFLVFQCVSADGATYSGSYAAEFHYAIRMDYEDL